MVGDGLDPSELDFNRMGGHNSITLGNRLALSRILDGHTLLTNPFNQNAISRTKRSADRRANRLIQLNPINLSLSTPTNPSFPPQILGPNPEGTILIDSQ